MRVAQLDRALDYGSRCREFESSRARVERLELSSLFLIHNQNVKNSMFLMGFSKRYYMIVNTTVLFIM